MGLNSVYNNFGLKLNLMFLLMPYTNVYRKYAKNYGNSCIEIFALDVHHNVHFETNVHFYRVVQYLFYMGKFSNATERKRKAPGKRGAITCRIARKCCTSKEQTDRLVCLSSVKISSIASIS